jgi:exosome complex component RRP4
MSELIKDREFVIPGDKIVESLDYLPGKNTFREETSIYSKRIGLVNFNNRVIEVISLAGVYMPEVGDMIIGEVEDVQQNGWVVNITSPFTAFLPLSGIRDYIDTTKTDLSKIYGIGDVIYGKIFSISPSKSIHISMQDIRARKFSDGRIIKISPAKVPRLIGKQGSMINLIKEKTGCRITAGQNGLIWFQGENEHLAFEAISFIEEKSHTEGLTDYIEKFLSEKLKKS